MAAAVRLLLRWLWEYHGAPKLDTHIRQYTPISPRNITVDRADIDCLLDALPTPARLWLLLCSDLAIRSGTAAASAPANYDTQQASLRFTTKHDARLTLPVTEEIARAHRTLRPANPKPFVRQLWKRGPSAKRRQSPSRTPSPDSNSLRRPRSTAPDASASRATRRLPHDLRRTTAVAMLEHTHDLRDVQALLGHANLDLDHLVPRPRPAPRQAQHSRNHQTTTHGERNNPHETRPTRPPRTDFAIEPAPRHHATAPAAQRRPSHHCKAEWSRAYDLAQSKGLPAAKAMRMAAVAYKLAMPQIDSLPAIRASIAAIAQGIRLEVFDGRDGSQLLYAAQVALSMLRHKGAKK